MMIPLKTEQQKLKKTIKLLLKQNKMRLRTKTLKKTTLTLTMKTTSLMKMMISKQRRKKQR